MTKKLKYRMYGLVPYNISPIQQGIQFGHAVVEYGLDFGKTNVINDKIDPYTQWARYDKTFIILNGGTTNDNEDSEFYGTLNQAKDEIDKMNIPYATFYEPDLGDQLTAVVFLVDERVWDKENYPDSTLFYEKEFDAHANILFENFKKVHGDEWDYIAMMQSFLSRFRLA